MKSSGFSWSVAWKNFKRKLGVKGVRCPFCREELNYRTLWYYRESSVGSCRQCGQKFRIKYSPVRFVVFFLLLAIAVVAGILVYRNFSSDVTMLAMFGLALVFVIFYLVMPLTMKVSSIGGGERKGVVDLNTTMTMKPIREGQHVRGTGGER